MGILRKMAPWLLAVIGAFIAVSLFGRMTFHIEAFQFQIYLELFDHGITEINIPPLGTIKAVTHQTPLKMGVILQNVDIDLLRNLLENPPDEQTLVGMAKTRLFRVAEIFVVRLLLLAVIGAMAAMLTLHKTDWKSFALAGLLGFLVLGLMLSGTIFTYDVNSFLTPRYEGILSAAPWMLGLAEETIANVNTLGSQLELVADNLYRLFSQIQSMQVMGTEGDLLLLHVSDIHNNPAAYDFIARVADSFKVDAILDTGDISDFGTPLEAQLVKRISQLKSPYYFIAGNHDSPEIIKAMQGMKNVTVIKNTVVEFNGLKLAGFLDPMSASTEIQPAANESQIMKEAEKGIRKAIKEKGPADVIMVHNHYLGRRIAGLAPVILFGHNHQLDISENNNSVLIDAGTTGAAGIRGLQTSNEIPYTLVLLRFSLKEKEYHLIAADAITVYNLRSGFTLERRIFEKNTDDEENNTESKQEKQ